MGDWFKWNVLAEPFDDLVGWTKDWNARRRLIENLLDEHFCLTSIEILGIRNKESLSIDLIYIDYK